MGFDFSTERLPKKIENFVETFSNHKSKIQSVKRQHDDDTKVKSCFGTIMTMANQQKPTVCWAGTLSGNFIKSRPWKEEETIDQYSFMGGMTEPKIISASNKMTNATE